MAIEHIGNGGRGSSCLKTPDGAQQPSLPMGIMVLHGTQACCQGTCKCACTNARATPCMPQLVWRHISTMQLGATAVMVQARRPEVRTAGRYERYNRDRSQRCNIMKYQRSTGRLPQQSHLHGFNAPPQRRHHECCLADLNRAGGWQRIGDDHPKGECMIHHAAAAWAPCIQLSGMASACTSTGNCCCWHAAGVFMYGPVQRCATHAKQQLLLCRPVTGKIMQPGSHGHVICNTAAPAASHGSTA